MSRTPTALRRSTRSLVVLVATVSALAASALAYADGIDVSNYQGTVSWATVDSAGVTFAFMKASEGTYYADPTLRTNWAGAQRQGIYRGAYHFARPSTSPGSAAAQARYFVARVGSFQDKGDLPPVLDLEASGGLGSQSLTSWVASWLSTVEQLTGRTPIIYCSPSFWEDRLANSTAFHHYPLWVANYGVSSPRVPGGWSTWTFWQRSSVGRVPGIVGNVDMNRFNGSGSQLALMANTTSGSTAPPPGGPTLPAGAAATLSLAAATGSVAPGQNATFTGDLRNTAHAGVTDHAVSLWTRSLGSSTWSKLAGGTTDSAGHYRLAAPARSTADYQARSAADSTYAPAVSAVVRVTTSARSATALDLHKNRATGHPGTALMLYGHLTSADGGVAGVPVRYYKRSLDGLHWIYVGTSRSVAPTGWHSLVVHPKVGRVWKVVSAGNNAYAPRTSAFLTVRVG